MNATTFQAFSDEMAKIAEAEGMDKEAFVQYLAGAGKALGAMGSAGARMAQTGWKAGQEAMQAGGGLGQAISKGWQAAGGKAGVSGQLARGAERGWKTGVGRMKQVGQMAPQGGLQGAAGWVNRQKQMLGAMNPMSAAPSTQAVAKGQAVGRRMMAQG